MSVLFLYLKSAIYNKVKFVFICILIKYHNNLLLIKVTFSLFYIKFYLILLITSYILSVLVTDVNNLD